MRNSETSDKQCLIMILVDVLYVVFIAMPRCPLDILLPIYRGINLDHSRLSLTILICNHFVRWPYLVQLLSIITVTKMASKVVEDSSPPRPSANSPPPSPSSS